MNSSKVAEMEDGLWGFMWQKGTTQDEGKILLGCGKTCGVIWDWMLST